jgi:hypothetical protein
MNEVQKSQSAVSFYNRINSGMKHVVRGLMLGSGALVATVPFSASAQATYAADAATQVATLTAQFDTVYEAAFTVMLGIVVAMVVWKYAKKLGSKV